ncbi:MAG: hypothetical protein ABI723_00345 [Bacteroidia bacterium]
MDENQNELKKTRDILMATLDYTIELYDKSEQKLEGFNPIANLKDLKKQAEEHYQKGRLTKLKQWLRDMTEMPREVGDLTFTIFIKKKTGYDYDIFSAFNRNIEKIIEKGKITTGNQFRDVNSMVDFLCQTDPLDKKKIEVLNKLLLDFEKRLSN